jgi:hypothetical protein
MPYELKHRLVVGVASSALFDLDESDRIFQENGEEEYRKYQEKHRDNHLNAGSAFPFIRRLLQSDGLEKFQEHELVNAIIPHEPGPLRNLLLKINAIQRIEEKILHTDRSYKKRLRVAIVTSRNAPADERAVLSLKNWGVTVDDAFFLGGIAKGPIIRALEPDIFFDDQMLHVEQTSDWTPSVHIPYGALNRRCADEDNAPQANS